MTAGLSAGSPLDALQSAGAVPKLIRASKTFTGAANLGATGVNELFTTTGAVAIDGFWVRCTTSLVDAVDGAIFKIGVTGADAILTDVNYEGAFDLDTLDADMWLDNSGGVPTGHGANLAAQAGSFATVSANIIMTITTQAITGGALAFYVLYRPLSADGALALGAGMVAV